jgi:hypothetical protein
MDDELDERAIGISTPVIAMVHIPAPLGAKPIEDAAWESVPKGHADGLFLSGVNLSLTRLYGRAALDQRVVDSTPQPSGPQTTTLAVIGWTGVTAPLVLSGAVNGTLFYGYIQQCVFPTLKPGDILFMDNLSAHKVAELEELLRAGGAHLIYLPPYPPDFNPIELA